jgi:hypothetical protein
VFLPDWSASRHHIGRWSKGVPPHLYRFVWLSPHCHDLRLISILALGFAALFTHRVNDGFVWCIDELDTLVPPISAVGSYCKAALRELPQIADGKLGVPLLGGALAVVGWAYQAANTRFGVADLFAAEIATLCRAAASAEFLPRYILLYRQKSKFPSVESPRDYFSVFNNNAKDLEALDGDVARYTTQFYVHMKALMDALGRTVDPGIGEDRWREQALSVIYDAFLAFESGRQALTVLMDDRHDRMEYVLTVMLSELPAYLLLCD